MFQRIVCGSVLFALFTMTCLFLTGCASEAKKAPVAAAAAPPPPATLSQMKGELIAAKAQLDITNTSLNTLSKSTNADAQANYDKFATEYTKLQSQSEACKKRANDLKVRTQEYYDTWKKQADVENADLRRQVTQQRADAERTYSNIKSEVELTRLSFEPYMSSLKDVGNYLRGNVSPAAIASTSGLVTKANADFAETNKHLDAVLTEINKIMAASGEMVAPSAAAAPVAPGAPAAAAPVAPATPVK